MLSESHPLIRQTLRFLALPYCYLKLVDWNACTASKFKVAFDLLYIFFKFKYYPDNYAPCRFFEISRDDWKYYYGSSYHSYQRFKLRNEVQTYERQIVFDDKVICEQLCKGMNVRMPVSFGTVNPDRDYKKKLKNIFSNNNYNKLIIKPILGHAGRGIQIAEFLNNDIIVHNGSETVEIDDFVLPTESLVQEVITQLSDISEFSSSSVNTIRVLTLYTKNDEIIPISSTMRFGVGKAFVDNWSAGGIAVGVDHNSGKLKKFAFDKKGNRYTEHPISKKVFKDFQIPMWDEVIQIALKVQEACSFYKLIGMDIALTENGPILIEVNANPDLVFQEQTSGPLLKDDNVLKEFDNYDLLINKFQKGLLTCK